jgi:hypothetical protein
MPLFNASALIGYLRTFRVLWVGGRYGGGKTALAYRLAHELLSIGASRYIISNVRSVWNDKMSSVRIRRVEGRFFVDTVLILDEAGLFLRTSSDADAYLSFLRKINVILILASVTPPATRVRFLTCNRAFNLNSFGLPAWVYSYNLSYMSVAERDYFTWWRPSEIFGIYDTAGAPSDDAGIHSWLDGLRLKYQKESGYAQKETYEDYSSPSISMGSVASQGGRSFDTDISSSLEEFNETISSFREWTGRRQRGR